MEEEGEEEKGDKGEGLKVPHIPHNDSLNKHNNQSYFRFQIVNFVMQNNLPFSISGKLVSFWKDLLETHDVNALLNFTANRNHVSAIASSCIGPYLQKKLLERLARTYFSIAVDEGTAKGNIQYLVINARFFANDNDTQTTTKLLGLIEMGESSTGEELYNRICNFLFSGNEGQVRTKNLIGVSSDHASNMISKLDAGATNRLKKAISQIVVVHDFCHALNLILKDTINVFPKKYVRIVSEIASTFSQSPQRSARLRRIAGAGSEHKILAIKGYVPTRWSSFQECLQRILEMVGPLKEYFQEEAENNDQKEYLNEQNLAMLRLLLGLVNAINFYIKYFQRENLDIMNIVQSLKNCLVIFGQYILEVSNDNLISADSDFKDPDSIFNKILELIEAGEDSELYKKSIKSQDQFENYLLKKHPEFKRNLEDKEADFRARYCKAASKFLAKAFEGIKKRLPVGDSCLLLADSFLLKKVSSLKKLRELATHFPNVIPEEEIMQLSDELGRLELNASELRDKIKASKCFLDVWRQEKQNYPLIYRLALAIQVLPYSTASVERNFSTTADLKTIKRNRLGVKNLEATLLVKQEFKDESTLLTSELLAIYNSLNDIIPSDEEIDASKPNVLHSERENMINKNKLEIEKENLVNNSDINGDKKSEVQNKNIDLLKEKGTFFEDVNMRNMFMEMTGAFFQSALRYFPTTKEALRAKDSPNLDFSDDDNLHPVTKKTKFSQGPFQGEPKQRPTNDEQPDKMIEENTNE